MHTFSLRFSLRHGKLGHQPLCIAKFRLDSGNTFLVSHARAYYSFYDMPGSQRQASETTRRTRDTTAEYLLLVLWFAFSISPRGTGLSVSNAVQYISTQTTKTKQKYYLSFVPCNIPLLLSRVRVIRFRYYYTFINGYK